MARYIVKEVWGYLRAQNTKIAQKCLEALDEDIAFFYSDGWEILIEKTYSGAVIPDYLYNYIKRHEKKILSTVKPIGG
jgi:hypothetical protein